MTAVCGRLLLAVDVVLLLAYPDKGGALGELFQLAGAHVGTGGAHAAQNVAHGILDRTAVGQQHGFTLGGAVFGNAAGMFVHGAGGAHAVELHEGFAVYIDDLATALFVGCQHAAQHDEVGTAAERFGDVARAGTAAVTDDLAAEAVGRIGTLDDGGELRITDTGLDASGADRARADADLDDVGAGEDQLFDHLAGHHVARQNDVVGAGFTNFAHELDEVFGVAIGHVDTDEAQRFGHGEDLAGLGEIFSRGAGGDHHMAQQRRVGLVDESLPLLKAVVLVYRGHHLETGQRARHGKAADGIHVGGDNGYALPLALSVFEGELTGQAYLGTALESRALGAEQDILETELQVFFDTHYKFLIEPC